MLCMQAAALAEASNTFGPTAIVGGGSREAIGRSAAATAPSAFAMPLPQVVVVQWHSGVCCLVEVGAWHFGTVVRGGAGGNALLLPRSRVAIWAGDRLALT